jgi:protoporphyrinogen IX oxidase
MTFQYLKALHIIFVVTWFAGLFYIVRLFIYHIEANDKPETERNILQGQFKIMEKRLWYGITWPSMILTWIFGLWLAIDTGYIRSGWLHIKLLFVLLLTVYHFLCGGILKQLHNNIYKWTSTQLRIWNEVATLFLVAIVFMVIFKNLADLAWGVAGFIVFGILLMAAIGIYKKIRNKGGEKV